MKKIFEYLLDRIIFEVDKSIHTSRTLFVMLFLASIGVDASFLVLSYGHPIMSIGTLLAWTIGPTVAFLVLAVIIFFAAEADSFEEWFRKPVSLSDDEGLASSIILIASGLVIVIHNCIVFCKYIPWYEGLCAGIGLGFIMALAYAGASVISEEFGFNYSEKFRSSFISKYNTND